MALSKQYIKREQQSLILSDLQINLKQNLILIVSDRDFSFPTNLMNKTP